MNKLKTYLNDSNEYTLEELDNEAELHFLELSEFINEESEFEIIDNKQFKKRKINYE